MPLSCVTGQPTDTRSGTSRSVPWRPHPASHRLIQINPPPPRVRPAPSRSRYGSSVRRLFDDAGLLVGQPVEFVEQWVDPVPINIESGVDWIGLRRRWPSCPSMSTCHQRSAPFSTATATPVLVRHSVPRPLESGLCTDPRSGTSRSAPRRPCPPWLILINPPPPRAVPGHSVPRPSGSGQSTDKRSCTPRSAPR